tara:strand:+ start:310 stop:633 length:324 start_codon:yes stop_codon:yes gene_type:complete
MNNSSMGPYLMRKNMRGGRRSSGVEIPQKTRVSNFDNNSMMDINELVSKRELGGGDQGGYFHDSNREDLAVKFSNNRNQIADGRSGNAGIVGYDRNNQSRARLERRR